MKINLNINIGTQVITVMFLGYNRQYEHTGVKVNIVPHKVRECSESCLFLFNMCLTQVDEFKSLIAAGRENLVCRSLREQGWRNLLLKMFFTLSVLWRRWELFSLIASSLSLTTSSRVASITSTTHYAFPMTSTLFTFFSLMPASQLDDSKTLFVVSGCVGRQLLLVTHWIPWYL